MHPARKRRALFICGSLNQTKQLHRVACELSETENWFSPFFGSAWVDLMRRAKLLESTIGGDTLRAKCAGYLEQHALPIDVDARRFDYDLVVACTDLALPPRLRRVPTLVVQEGMTDPENVVSRLVQKSNGVLPLWAAGTTLTGTSGRYTAMCVASEGYRELFVKRGAPADKLRVTGIPNFDDCARFRDNTLRYFGYVLACTSDLRETLRPDDRARFLERVRATAAGRPIHVKLHPNERKARATREIARYCPGAVVHTDGSAEELIANCSVLFTQYSSVAFVGLALAKEVYSYQPIAELRRLLPIQNGGRSAQAIAEVARELVGLSARATSGAARGVCA
jgi:hypothetical protein